MFEYLSEKHRFTIKLGQYISYNIVNPLNRYDGSQLATPEELNQMDRFDLARKVIATLHKEYLVGDYDKSTLIKDTAIYIDRRIPQSYAKWVQADHSRGPKQMKIGAEAYGLIYHFEENCKNKSTNKSIIRSNSTLEKQMVSDKSIYNSSVIEETKEQKLDTLEQVKEANFQQLKKYLKDNDLYINKNLFKAVLFAMNGMSLYYQTKAGAIKKASILHNVTQRDIKSHIDDMKVISQRERDNKNRSRQAFGKYNGITTDQLRKRLDREY